MLIIGMLHGHEINVTSITNCRGAILLNYFVKIQEKSTLEATA